MVIPWALMETGFISKQKVYRDTYRDGGILMGCGDMCAAVSSFGRHSA